MDLSIVIPAFEESKKIARDVKAAARVPGGQLAQGGNHRRRRRQPGQNRRSGPGGPCPAVVKLNVIRYEQHRGKGYGVRTGMKASTGQYAMFADCGLCIPYGNALQGLEMLKNGQFDIAHGSRRHIQSDILQDQPWHRRLLSRTFKFTVRTMLGTPRELTDTQCGFKIYKGDVARELYGQCTTDGFLFDIEIILRAVRKGYRIGEFPVEWACDPDSRLSVTRTPWPVLAELYRLKRAMARNLRQP